MRLCHIPRALRAAAALAIIAPALLVRAPSPATAVAVAARATAAVPRGTGPGAGAVPVPGATGTIVAIGDSITAGSYDTAVRGGWVARLAAKLGAAYPGAGLVVRNAGIGGDTSWGVLARLRRDVIAADPRLVIVSIGTNDFNSGVPARAYARTLRAIVARLRAMPHPPVLVLASLLPFAGLAPDRLRAEEAYNDVIRRTAAADGIGYLDLFDQWLALGPVYWRTLRHDTVHPNPIGYELMADVTAAFLEGGYLDRTGAIAAPALTPTCGGCGATSRPANG